MLHAAGGFLHCSLHTHSNPSLTGRESYFEKNCQNRFLHSRQKKTAKPNRKLIFLFCSNKCTSLSTTMCSPRRKFRPARGARFHIIPCTVACKRRCPRCCDERIMKMTMLGTYLTSTHTRWRELFFGDLHVSSEAWRALLGSRANQFRWVPLENGWDGYVMTPLIGQHSVSVTMLTNQLFFQR